MDREKGIISDRLEVSLSLAILFISSFTYFYWFGSELFFYQENNMLFIFSSEYLQKFTVKPGGLLIYAGNFLSQGYYNNAYGSIFLSSVLVLFCLVIIKIYKHLSAYRSMSFLFILLPSCMLLLLQKRVDHFLYHNLGYLLVVIYFLLSIISEKKTIRIIILCTFPVFYYVVGSFALIFIGMYILYSVIYEKGILRYILPSFLIAIVFLTYFIFKEVIFLQPIDRLLTYPITGMDLSHRPVYLYLLCGYIVLFPLLIKISGSLIQNIKSARIISMVVLLTVLLIPRTNSPVLPDSIHLEKFLYNQDWDEIIRQCETSPSKDLIGQYYYNLALANKGQLCERLFFGRQYYGTESLTLPLDNETMDKAIYFYYTIGLISEAHHLAYESMVRYGYSPENLKLLIKTNLINGHYKVAERYVKVLKQTLHYRKWAENYEKMLYNPSMVNSDPELGEKIKLLPKKDFFIRSDDVQNIELFLMANKDNKSAFEYKMARLLFEKDFETIVYEVKKMKGMGYTYIPRHIEEAVLEFINVKKEYPDLGGLTINRETELRFANYNRINDLTKKGNKSSLEKEMEKDWGNTFWYYLQFN